MKQEKVNLFDRILFRKIMSFSRPYQDVSIGLDCGGTIVSFFILTRIY